MVDARAVWALFHGTVVTSVRVPFTVTQEPSTVVSTPVGTWLAPLSQRAGPVVMAPTDRPQTTSGRWCRSRCLLWGIWLAAV